jgi:hypothetical protein
LNEQASQAAEAASARPPVSLLGEEMPSEYEQLPANLPHPDRDPSVAAKAVWWASGHGRPPVVADRLARPLTQVQEADLVVKGCAVMNPYQLITCCASCGEMVLGVKGRQARPLDVDDYYLIPIGDRHLMATFRATQDVVLLRERLSGVSSPSNLSSMVRVVQIGDTLMSLYAEGISADGNDAAICKRCFKSVWEAPRRATGTAPKAPKFSLASGFQPGLDLPRLLNLPRNLTPAEMVAISFTAVCSYAVKIVAGEMTRYACAHSRPQASARTHCTNRALTRSRFQCGPYVTQHAHTRIHAPCDAPCSPLQV